MPLRLSCHPPAYTWFLNNATVGVPTLNSVKKKPKHKFVQLAFICKAASAESTNLGWCSKYLVKKFAYKWTCKVQTDVVQGLTVHHWLSLFSGLWTWTATTPLTLVGPGADCRFWDLSTSITVWDNSLQQIYFYIDIHPIGSDSPENPDKYRFWYHEVECCCKKYLKMWKLLRNWKIGGGQRSFEVHANKKSI